ncbi:MAG: leucine-rich repeat protein [Prevotella sp.]|nr:leucine-rich repeat protein [Prevotella sp.]
MKLRRYFIILFLMLTICLGDIMAQTFTAKTVEGVNMNFAITSTEKMTCEVAMTSDGSAISQDYNGPVTIPSVANGYTVTSIGRAAFALCKITSASIPNTVTAIEGQAFSACNSLTSLVLPESLISIGDNAFEFCENLKSITIPNSITALGNGVFCRCSELEEVNLPSSITFIPYDCFESCKSLRSIQIPEKVTSIAKWAFAGCEKLSGISLPSNLTEIGEQAFAECAFTSFILPQNVSTLGKGFIEKNPDLASIKVLFENPISITDDVFTKEDVFDKVTLYVPKGSAAKFTAATGWNKFNQIQEMDAVGDIFTAKTVEGVDMLFRITDIANMTCEVGTGSSETPAISKECNGIVTIPESANGYKVTGISFCAFVNRNLVGISIPEGVTTIGRIAFGACENLASVSIPNTVTSIEPQAFSQCKSLTSLELPEGLQSIGFSAFEDCENLKSITIPNSVTDLQGFAFLDCEKLESVILSNAITSISNVCFCGCKSLRSIQIPESVMTIESTAFGGCEMLSEITLPSHLTSIGSEAFGECAFTTIVLPESITSLGDAFLESCPNLHSIKVLFENPISITDDVFNKNFLHDNYDNIYQNVTLFVPTGSKAKFMAAEYWNKFSHIAEVGEIDKFFTAQTEEGVDMTFEIVSETNKTCQVARWLGNLPTISQDYEGTVTIPAVANGYNVIAIGDNAFAGCQKLTGVVVPNSVTSIAPSIFIGCI